ncbi:hypothetical protein FRC17_008269 [Serendipita sp. 399]|nr:hypothetical protein FRC17_008269 [Serendipita sp. 399]
MAPTIFNILHFNDVYRVSKQNVEGGTIDVSQWAQMLEECRERWPTREQDGLKDGLLLFSGDVFSPSIESSVTRGSHMVPIMNALGIDCAVAGNHDFDWSAPHFLKLVKDSNYPWLLSNIIDSDTGKVPDGLHTFQVVERSGVRVGIIGLVEEDWIKTISSWPSNYKYQDMTQVATDLSKQLRDPSGDQKCDLIIALTHSRLPNDLALAEALHARVGPSTIQEHGCDIILGGHDHVYYVSKFDQSGNTDAWKGYDITQAFLGAEKDDGVLVVKSGTDFRELSEIQLELEDAPEGSVRCKYISSVKGTRHITQPDSKSSEKVAHVVKGVTSHIEGSLSKAVCKLDAVLDCRSSVVRLGESASGNWFADVIFHAYDDALCVKGQGGADAVFICGGTLRGDSTYGPGDFTVGNIMEILPFQDPIIVIQMEGHTIWEALESALGTWPAQEGRFPIVSGLKVEWDSQRRKGQRVLSVVLLENNHDRSDDQTDPDGESTTHTPKETPVDREPGGRTYTIVTRLYMAQGFDGYDAFKDCRYLVDEENGRTMADLVRHFLLGHQYINLMKSLATEDTPVHLSEQTSKIIESERQRHKNGTSKHGKSRWADIVREKLMKPGTNSYSSNSYRIASKEHMSAVDCVDGARIRQGSSDQASQEGSDSQVKDNIQKELVVVSPRIDSRLKDVSKES